MATVTESVLVRRPYAVVAAVATDPDVVLPLIGGFGRFDLIARHDDGSEEWDLFLDVGTIHVGGRILADPPDGRTLAWRSIRGTEHTALLEVLPVVMPGGEHARIVGTMTVDLAGAVTGRVAGWLAGGILRRHLVAGLEQLRHHLEHGLSV